MLAKYNKIGQKSQHEAKKKIKWNPGHRDGVDFVHIYICTGVYLPGQQTS